MRWPRVSPRDRRMLFCAVVTVAGSTAALAQDGGSHPLDAALDMLNLRTEPGPMPDFVQQSRHDLSKDSYMAVGAKPASRELKVKTPAEVKALTAELDAARTAQLAGKRPKPPSAQAGGAGKPTKPGQPLPLGRKAQQATNR